MMNELAPQNNDPTIQYQAGRLRELISGIVHCCEERMAGEADALGLTGSELACLQLFDHEKYLTVKGIAHRLGVAKSRVTKILDGLAFKGLAVRMEDPGDARSKLVGLTPAGRAKVRMVADVIMENHCRLLLELTADERKNVITCLERLNVSMEIVKTRRESENVNIENDKV